MCGRYRLARDERRIAEHFEIEDWREIRIPFQLPRFNVAPTQAVPVVRTGGGGKRELVALRWGLVPPWAKGRDTGYSMINARAETVAEKPAFRDAFRRRRCLIPSDGFYEWQTLGKHRQPWLIRLKGQDLFALAGIWEQWRGIGGGQLETFAVIVTPANELLKPIHERMPAIVSPDDYAAWLDVEHFDRERLGSLLAPYPPDRMEAYRVGTRVNAPSNDDELCSAPLEVSG